MREMEETDGKCEEEMMKGAGKERASAADEW